MAYVGFPVSLEEAIGLMEDVLVKHTDYQESLFSDQKNFNDALKKFTTLRHYWIDKNQCILGVEIHNVALQFWDTKNVDEVILEILDAKQRFKKEIARLNVDLSSVTFCHMEEEDSIHTNPEPCVFFASF